MMRWHRMCVVFASLLLAYVALTGTGIQLADMRALVTHAPETDPDMQMMRQHIYGPPNYAVVSAPDYTAPALPSTLDMPAAMQRVAALGRAAADGQPLRLIELRMAQGKVAAHVQVGTQQKIFDLATGAPLPAADLPPPQPGRDFFAPRAFFKGLHRFNAINGGTALNGLASIALAVLLVTGLIHYTRLYRARARMGRTSPWWKAGNWWRNLHRWTAITASVLILWVAVSGFLLSLDNVGAFVHSAISGARAPGAFDGDQSSPMADTDIAPMTLKTLAAYKAAVPATGIKVIRLRYFVGYPQGVIVGADPATTQHVFNARTGAPMAMWEKNYPDLSFPSGWEVHQLLKRIHRGDIFGMTGRWLDLAAGLSLIYLTLSGIVMYLHLWLRRRQSGRGALFWS